MRKNFSENELKRNWKEREWNGKFLNNVEYQEKLGPQSPLDVNPSDLGESSANSNVVRRYPTLKTDTGTKNWNQGNYLSIIFWTNAYANTYKIWIKPSPFFQQSLCRGISKSLSSKNYYHYSFCFSEEWVWESKNIGGLWLAHSSDLTTNTVHEAEQVEITESKIKCKRSPDLKSYESS